MILIFNSFIAANDYNFGVQLTEWLSCFCTDKFLKAFV